MNFLVTLSRILVGSLFIVSGLIKANDALGFSYKLEEYFSPDVLNMEFLIPFALPMAILICAAEVLLGFASLLGAKMKLTSWLLLVLIVFFTWLTFYSAYFNKVTDCGCFGDAIKLTPWQSFGKDILLLVFILVLFFNRNKLKLNNAKEDYLLFSSALFVLLLFSFGLFQWFFPVVFYCFVVVTLLVIKRYAKESVRQGIMGTVAFLVTLGFTMYCYWHLPIRDFRPYAIGKSIPAQMTLPEGAQEDVYETTFTYRNKTTGEVSKFGADNYPWDDSTWTWVSTENELLVKGDEAPIHDFSLTDVDGVDITDALLEETSPVLLLVAYDIEKSCEKVQKEVNELAQQAFGKNYYFYGATASLYDEVESFRHKHQLMFDFLSADETTLKTIVRSNPGLVLLKEGVIMGKWHYNDLPGIAQVESALNP